MRLSKTLLLAVLLVCLPGIVSANEVEPRSSEIMPLANRLPMVSVSRAGDHLVAVGAKGVILKSNNGTSWQQVDTPVNRMLTSVYFIDDKYGWAVGHDQSILHTNNGGQNWLIQYFNSGDTPLLDVFFLDRKRGFAIGAFGTFLYTVNGGAQWASLGTGEFNELGYHLNALTRLGNDELIVVGEFGLVGYSQNGMDWAKLPLPYSGSLFDVQPIGESGALVVGMRGNAFWTNDVYSGLWHEVDTGTLNSLFSISRDNDTNQYTIAGANSTLLKFLVEPELESYTLHALLSKIDEVMVFSDHVVDQDSIIVLSEQGPVVIEH